MSRLLTFNLYNYKNKCVLCVEKISAKIYLKENKSLDLFDQFIRIAELARK